MKMSARVVEDGPSRESKEFTAAQTARYTSVARPCASVKRPKPKHKLIKHRHRGVAVRAACERHKLCASHMKMMF